MFGEYDPPPQLLKDRVREVSKALLSGHFIGDGMILCQVHQQDQPPVAGRHAFHVPLSDKDFTALRPTRQGVRSQLIRNRYDLAFCYITIYRLPE